MKVLIRRFSGLSINRRNKTVKKSRGLIKFTIRCVHTTAGEKVNLKLIGLPGGVAP